MLRSTLSVLAGTATWTVFWLSLNALLTSAIPQAFREDGSTSHPGVLTLILISSVVFSILAGFVTALLARGKEISHGIALGILQLAIGIFVQIQFWDAMPIWYHLSFLVLLLPGNVLGAWLRAQRGPRGKSEVRNPN